MLLNFEDTEINTCLVFGLVETEKESIRIDLQTDIFAFKD